jgi:hypothetical protein
MKTASSDKILLAFEVQNKTGTRTWKKDQINNGKREQQTNK